MNPPTKPPRGRTHRTAKPRTQRGPDQQYPGESTENNSHGEGHPDEGRRSNTAEIDRSSSDATPSQKRERLESKRGSLPSPDSAREWRPICDYCGMPIDHDHQRCAALDDGVCRP